MQEEFWAELTAASAYWQFYIGRFGFGKVFPSGKITAVIVALTGGCFIAGIILCLPGSAAHSIGVPLLVGAIFSFGAFLAQYWAVAVQFERHVAGQVGLYDKRIGEMREMMTKITSLEDRINRLDPGDT